MTRIRQQGSFSGVLDGFTQHFSTTMLNEKQPWVLRVTDQLPGKRKTPMAWTKSPHSRSAPPVQPAARRFQRRDETARSRRYADAPAQGSSKADMVKPAPMRAEMEPNLDPLGLVTSSLKPSPALSPWSNRNPSSPPMAHCTSSSSSQTRKASALRNARR